MLHLAKSRGNKNPIQLQNEWTSWNVIYEDSPEVPMFFYFWPNGPVSKSVVSWLSAAAFILDKKKLGIMKFKQNFRVKFDNFFYFRISEDSFDHHLSQIRKFYLKQQLSRAVLSMTTP